MAKEEVAAVGVPPTACGVPLCGSTAIENWSLKICHWSFSESRTGVAQMTNNKFSMANSQFRREKVQCSDSPTGLAQNIPYLAATAAAGLAGKGMTRDCKPSLA